MVNRTTTVSNSTRFTRVSTSVRYVCACMAVLGSAALAQNPPILLKSTTRLVQVSVIADRHGEPVADLKQDDFHIQDNGKQQKISFFQVESDGILPSTPENLPPNTFTNRLQQQSGVPSAVTVILLDALNTKFTDQAYAKAQVIKFLQTIQPEDHIGIYTLGGSLKVLHDYTTDSTELLRQLASYRGQIPTPNLPDLSASEPNVSNELLQMDNWLNFRGMSGAERDFYTVNRVRGTLRAIEFIADHLSAIPGRKNLIWVSGGFPLMIGFDNPNAWKDPSRDMVSFMDEIDRTVRALNDANVAVYPVDARGLLTDPRFNASSQRIAVGPLRPGQFPPPPPGSKNQATMIELASRTGGRAYYNTNDLKNAIRDAVADARVSYSIGFYPDSSNFDGKFHKLTLKVDQSGVSLRYRKGYFDFAQSPQDDKQRLTELHDAVWSPLEASAIPMTAQLVPAGKPNAWEVYVKVDHSGISLEPQDDRWQGKLDVLYVQKNDQGRDFNGTDNTINLNAQQATYDKIVSEGLGFHQTVQRNPQATSLRIVVRDAPSGNIGTVTVPFKALTP